MPRPGHVRDVDGELARAALDPLDERREPRRVAAERGRRRARAARRRAPPCGPSVSRLTTRSRSTGSDSSSGSRTEKNESRLPASSPSSVEADRHPDADVAERSVVALEPAPQRAGDDREHRVVEGRAGELLGGVVERGRAATSATAIRRRVPILPVERRAVQRPRELALDERGEVGAAAARGRDAQPAPCGAAAAAAGPLRRRRRRRPRGAPSAKRIAAVPSASAWWMRQTSDGPAAGARDDVDRPQRPVAVEALLEEAGDLVELGLAVGGGTELRGPDVALRRRSPRRAPRAAPPRCRRASGSAPGTPAIRSPISPRSSLDAGSARAERHDLAGVPGDPGALEVEDRLVLGAERDGSGVAHDRWSHPGRTGVTTEADGRRLPMERGARTGDDRVWTGARPPGRPWKTKPSEQSDYPVDKPIWSRFFTIAPLVIVGTTEGDGYDLAAKHMAMPLGWDNCFCFVCSPEHATQGNAERSGAFTVSFPRPDGSRRRQPLGLAARRTTTPSPGWPGIRTFPARVVDGVLVEDSNLWLECELERIVEGFGRNTLIVGRIVAAAADRDALRAGRRRRCRPDLRPAAARLPEPGPVRAACRRASPSRSTSTRGSEWRLGCAGAARRGCGTGRRRWSSCSSGWRWRSRRPTTSPRRRVAFAILDELLSGLGFGTERIPGERARRPPARPPAPASGPEPAAPARPPRHRLAGRHARADAGRAARRGALRARRLRHEGRARADGVRAGRARRARDRAGVRDGGADQLRRGAEQPRVARAHPPPRRTRRPGSTCMEPAGGPRRQT